MTSSIELVLRNKVREQTYRLYSKTLSKWLNHIMLLLERATHYRFATQLGSILHLWVIGLQLTVGTP